MVYHRSRQLALVLVLSQAVNGWVRPPPAVRRAPQLTTRGVPLASSPPPTEEAEAVTPEMVERVGGQRNFDKLKEEAQNPLRAIRFFVYAAAGLNAFIGGLTSLTQLVGSAANAPNALPMEQVTTNLGVNFGVAALCGVLYRLDAASQETEIEQMNENIEKRKAARVAPEEASAREQRLVDLELVVSVGEDEGRVADVKTLQRDARQHVVIVCGGRGMISDTLLKAQIMGEKFQRQNILVVPVTVGQKDAAPSPKGFGKNKMEDKPYVAKPSNVGEWEDYMDTEFRTATAQAKGEDEVKAIKDAGIVIVVRRDGKIVRRGLGVPAWEMVISDLRET